MKRTGFALAAVVAAAGFWNLACTHEGEGHVHAGKASASAGARAVAVLEPKSGSNAKGKAVFVAKGGKVTMEIEVEGLTPGAHAIHLHETGDCTAPDAASAGAHWNPSAQDHGKWGTAPHHQGDIGNLVADETGRAKLFFPAETWAIGGGAANDIVGRSVIVHAGEDDFKTQPTGNAGGRVACAVIVLEKP